MATGSDDIDIPVEIVDLIQHDLETRGLDPGSVSPSEPTLALAGRYEQEYIVNVTFPDSREGMAIYSAYRQNDEWQVDHLVTKRK